MKGPNNYWMALMIGLGNVPPDFQHVIDNISVSEEDRDILMVDNADASGTTAGGEQMFIPAKARYRFENGKIAEAWIGVEQSRAE